MGLPLTVEPSKVMELLSTMEDAGYAYADDVGVEEGDEGLWLLPDIPRKVVISRADDNDPDLCWVVDLLSSVEIQANIRDLRIKDSDS